jgi:hypothetical protein
MTQHHVDLEHAKLLKEAGWDTKTEQVYIILENGAYVEDYFMFAVDCDKPLLWRPNLGELLDEISWDALNKYFNEVIWSKRSVNFDRWLDQTMRDPNALAVVWLWARKEKG